MEHGTSSAAALWGHEHLPLLARARSKDSVEYILQALWRTRRTGLDAADRAIVRDILQLPSDSELDPVRTYPLLISDPSSPSAPPLAPGARHLCKSSLPLCSMPALLSAAALGVPQDTDPQVRP